MYVFISDDSAVNGDRSRDKVDYDDTTVETEGNSEDKYVAERMDQEDRWVTNCIHCSPL